LVEVIDFTNLDKVTLVKAGIKIDHEIMETDNGPVLVVACLD
jgi:hypothetical protein